MSIWDTIGVRPFLVAGRGIEANSKFFVCRALDFYQLPA